MKQTFDAIIVGAGIMGLTLAHALKKRFPDIRLCILEKEPRIGLHASGRNSGVLHSGIYYKAGSLKAKLCAEGARKMAEYCEAHHLPIKKIGKVILPTRIDEDRQLDELCHRAKVNGVVARIIDSKELKVLEPAVISPTGRALHVPHTSVVDSKAILECLSHQLEQQGVKIILNAALEEIRGEASFLRVNGSEVRYTFLYNTAGQHADTIAHQLGAGMRYILLPFKGIYWALSSKAPIVCNGLIYPVPDLKLPFLGVHVTKTVEDKIYLGPTAVPAFGREHYRGFSGIDFLEGLKILYYLARQYGSNQQGFRAFTHQEAFRFFKKYFVQAAQALLPQLKAEDLLPSNKVGIRAQLFDKEKQALEMDFVVVRKENAVHILNAVSPAFTCSFSFSEYVVESYR
ncbi:MAG: L-2-hydroxyglutarate oxidase [Gammaproteobacteria bacterium]|nr:L-2-hydroxyglutarate oxidase [Gammaproteobacteria bacterium]